MQYTVVLEQQEEGGFSVKCVKLPGAISQDDSKEESLINIKEAIELVLAVPAEELHKKHIPPIRKLSKLTWQMSRILSVISGEKMVKLLAKQGFEIRWQITSHIMVQKEWRVFSVPLHKELKKGTL